LVVVAFILLTGRLAARMYPAGGSGWRRVLVPVLGSLGTGYLLWRYFPFARGSGIPQTKFALFIDDGRIMFRTVLGKFFCCSASLASGIALGREGPSVQVGAGIASVIARNLGLSPRQVKALVPAGCAAALAAAFNTPIAAVCSRSKRSWAICTRRYWVPWSSARPPPGWSCTWFWATILCSTSPLIRRSIRRNSLLMRCSVWWVGWDRFAFVKLLLGLRARFMRLPKSTAWFQPVVGGLTVGLMGYFVPEVLGVGYNHVEKVLNGDIVLKVVVLLAVLKIVATAVCYASGNAGGIFGPALFIGAMMGAAVGGVAHSLFPNYTAGPGAYALVGMGTAFAGIVRTPLTSVFMIFEITRDYTIIVPLMISNMIAYFISYKLQPQSIYDALAYQEGVRLPHAHSRSRAERIEVRQVMRSAPVVFIARPADCDGSRSDQRQHVRRLARRRRGRAIGNGSEQRTRTGRGRRSVHQRVGEILRDGSWSGQTGGEPPHVYPDHSLSVALERMGNTGLNVLPVVSRANVRQLMGMVALDDVLDAYGVAKRPGSRRGESANGRTLRRTIFPGNFRVGLPGDRGTFCGRYVSRRAGAEGDPD
jgi:chloride channel protein, CIC family